MNNGNTVEMGMEELVRARTGQSWMNYPAIFEGFMEKGIPEDEIKPRENVYTFKGWKALGRHVRRGEKGVQVCTWIPISEKVDETGESVRKPGKRPWRATVFHVSQTDPND